MRKLLKFIKNLICTLIVMLIIFVLALVFINVYVKESTKDKILTNKEAEELKDIDCIIVLGCSVNADKTPSGALENRLIQGIELYNNDVSDTILMSGDHSGDYYDEVTVMKNYAIDKGVNSSDVFLDHYGLSTYESMYRAKYVFGAKNIVIVTQEYHLYRALFIADKLGINAYGVAVDSDSNDELDIREFLARIKDFGNGYLKPTPSIYTEPRSLSGDGNDTNER